MTCETLPANEASILGRNVRDAAEREGGFARRAPRDAQPHEVRRPVRLSVMPPLLVRIGASPRRFLAECSALTRSRLSTWQGGEDHL